MILQILEEIIGFIISATMCIILVDCQSYIFLMLTFDSFHSIIVLSIQMFWSKQYAVFFQFDLMKPWHYYFLQFYNFVRFANI